MLTESKVAKKTRSKTSVSGRTVTSAARKGKETVFAQMGKFVSSFGTALSIHLYHMATKNKIELS